MTTAIHKPTVQALTAAAFTGVAFPALADQGGYVYGHPMWSGGWGHTFMAMGMMAVFMIAILVVIVAILKAPSGGDSATDILDQRYARGEIDAAEYSERKKTLKAKH